MATRFQVCRLLTCTTFLAASVAGQNARIAGKPNLNGLWQSISTANWDLEAHSSAPGAFWQLGAMGAMPPGLGVVDVGSIPYTPAALAKKQQNFENRAKLDPEAKCYMPGIPRANYMPLPFQIVQSQAGILFSYPFASSNRLVHMDHQIPAPSDTWMGWSNGKWEGDTLVIDVTGLNGLSWLDRAGNFASDRLHVVERFTLSGADHINYEATLDDPKTFTKPWKIALTLYRIKDKGAQLLDFKCVEYAEELLYGDVRKK